jgi:hypothetical protein
MSFMRTFWIIRFAMEHQLAVFNAMQQQQAQQPQQPSAQQVDPHGGHHHQGAPQPGMMAPWFHPGAMQGQVPHPFFFAVPAASSCHLHATAAASASQAQPGVGGRVVGRNGNASDQEASIGKRAVGRASLLTLPDYDGRGWPTSCANSRAQEGHRSLQPFMHAASDEHSWL